VKEEFRFGSFLHMCKDKSTRQEGHETLKYLLCKVRIRRQINYSDHYCTAYQWRSFDVGFMGFYVDFRTFCSLMA